MKKFVLILLVSLFLTGFAYADSLNVRTVGSYDITDIPSKIYVSEPYAYVSYYNEALRIIDVSNPASPSEIGSIGAPNYARPNEIHVDGSNAYVAYGQWANSNWVVTVDVSTPSAPFEVNIYEPVMRAHDVYAIGSHAYIAECDGLRILDVSTPSSPAELGWCGISVIYHPPSLDVREPYAYVGCKNSFRVIDVTDPAKPYEIGDCELPGTAWDVCVSDDYAYLPVYDPAGLYVVDISDPHNPLVVGSLLMTGYGQAVDASDTLAFVAVNFGGLRVIDISDPAHPVEVGFYDTPNIAEDVFYSGGYIYVTCHSAGLYIYEFGNFPVGVEESRSVFPITLSATLNRLDYDIPREAHLALFSADGREVHRQRLEGKGKWDAPTTLPKGVYFVRIHAESQSTQTKLILLH